MNLKELREEAWAIAREVGTTDTDRLWTTKEMNRYINRVYRYIARETRCIRDAQTAAVCRINVAPPADYAALQALALTDPFYADDLAGYNDPTSWLYHKLVAPRVLPISPLVIDIDEMKWNLSPWKLVAATVSKWQTNPFWERVVGHPTEYAKDYQNGYVALNYRTTSTDALLMTTRRMPLKDLLADTDVREYRLHYHDFMINGILEQMFDKRDTETVDPSAVSKYRALYMRDVDEVKQQEMLFDQRLKVNASMDAFR